MDDGVDDHDNADDDDGNHDGDNDDDIYIMMHVCLFVTKNEHLLVSMFFQGSFMVFMVFGRFPWFFKVVS